MSAKPFVDFYKQAGLVPTHQNISDLEIHFQRREALYRHLGLPKALLEGRAIIEFGPGSGHNAVFTASCRPAKYTLVDATPASLESTREVLALHYPNNSFEITDCDILQYSSNQKYDLVICEGVIPTQLNPAAFLAHIASFANRGGVVVMTCMDSVPLLAEMLRRYIAKDLIKEIHNFSAQTNFLVEYFTSDLEALPGMSRRYADWVIDQILHPWSGPLFSIPEAIQALGHGYEIYASSPHFLNDWRWYKDIQNKNFKFNDQGLESYFSQIHNLLDYRHVVAGRDPEKNRELKTLCDKIYDKLFFAERGEVEYPVASLIQDLCNIKSNIKEVHPQTILAIDDFIHCARLGDWQMLSDFRSFWGRGQQYLSFIRNNC